MYFQIITLPTAPKGFMGQSLINLISYYYGMSSFLGGSSESHSNRFELGSLKSIAFKDMGSGSKNTGIWIQFQAGFLINCDLEQFWAPLSLIFFICEMEIMKAPIC